MAHSSLIIFGQLPSFILFAPPKVIFVFLLPTHTVLTMFYPEIRLLASYHHLHSVTSPTEKDFSRSSSWHWFFWTLKFFGRTHWNNPKEHCFWTDSKSCKFRQKMYSCRQWQFRKWPNTVSFALNCWQELRPRNAKLRLLACHNIATARNLHTGNVYSSWALLLRHLAPSQ